MDDLRLGIALPNFQRGANVEAVEAAAATAERLGWHSAMTTDHVLIPREAAATYGDMLEALATLAYLAARTERLVLGTSVLVVPMRNAVILARELATIDLLSRGRLVVGVGIGWNEAEFANLGVGEQFHQRGRYTEEAIQVWRHLWSGSEEPFDGRFFSFRDFAFGPPPAQRGGPPIWIGGRSEPAVRRAGRLAAVYQSSSTAPDAYSERIDILRAAAEAAGRRMPGLSARVVIRFDEPPPPSGYVVSGDDEAIATELQRFLDLGVEHLLLAFGEVETARVVAAMERFDREVRPRLTAITPAVAGAA
jgi:probable F420-dependent oxidoreductase